MYIYALQDPFTSEIRYIGKCENKLCDRLSVHVCDAKTSGISTRGKTKGAWIRRLIKRQARPKIIPLIDGIHDKTDLCALEIFMIGLGREIGLPLFNITDGGEGALGTKHTEESKAKISKANRGRKRTDEARELMSKSATGRKASPEARANMSEAKKGVKMSDAARVNMSIAQKISKNNPESKEKMSQAMRGRVMSTETRRKNSQSQGGRPFVDDLGNIYYASREAAVATGCLTESGPSGVRAVLIGVSKKFNGRVFRYIGQTEEEFQFQAKKNRAVYAENMRRSRLKRKLAAFNTSESR